MSSNKKINNSLLVISEYMDKLELDNCRLRNSDEILNNVIKEKDKEIERLNNIINELEKDLEKERKIDRPRDDYNYGLTNALDYVWYKLQELKGGKQ